MSENHVLAALAVVYIARGADPNWQQRVTRFARSWKEHPPGTFYNLYITFKEFASVDDLLIANDALCPLRGTHILEFMKHNAFGGGCFQEVAAQLDEPLLCTLVSTTEIMHDNWLGKLARTYDERGGIVGCTGSREGNIHVRDTAIVVDRRLYLDISRQFDFTKSKDGYLDFEHGPNNLTIQHLRAGLPATVVEKERVLDSRDWPHTTYRGNMENVLVHDRGSRDFNDL